MIGLNELRGASDADLARMATRLARTEGDVFRVEAELREFRAKLRATDAKATRAAVGASAISGTRGGLALGKGPVKLGRAGVTVNAKAMKFGAAGYVVMGSLGTIAAGLKDWKENEAERARYGNPHFVGKRVWEAALTPITGGAAVVRDYIADIVGSLGGKEARRAYLKSAQDKDDFVIGLAAPGVQEQRLEARRVRRAQIKSAGEAYEAAEMAEIDSYKPENIQARTSRDMATLRRMIHESDDGRIKKDREALQDKLLEEAGIVGWD
jgi:hypothetical protein